MEKQITCFIAAGNPNNIRQTIKDLQATDCVADIFIVGQEAPEDLTLNEVAGWIQQPSMQTTGAIKAMAERCKTPYALIYTKNLPLQSGSFALHRMLQVADDTSAGILYADHYRIKNSVTMPHPVIDYQEGSLRDDFDFGSLLLINAKAMQSAAEAMTNAYQFAALYDLRLRISQHHAVVRLPEFLYTEMEIDVRLSGEKMFDYVDPKNRAVQIEMEDACTEHLKVIGGWLAPLFKDVDFDSESFHNEASVIIPVRNRIKTIEDAIKSVLNQKTDFHFNLIVVDNHSTDGTTELLSSYAKKDERLIHVIPERHDLGIGGCWNAGVFHTLCGKFAIQLDSDDLYINDLVVDTIVKSFYEQKCAMVVGSYQMVNFKLEEIPPGIIDHREWTPDNGRNNALRINGLGAPRAFYTPILRKIKVPNTSYGEDYALGLRISRDYQIGRLYEPLYLCRRWDENSDASLDIGKLNGHNLYKDRIRTIELKARIAKNNQKR